MTAGENSGQKCPLLNTVVVCGGAGRLYACEHTCGCSWEAHGASMEEERKQHPGGRYWLIRPYSCLVSGFSWAEGWLGATRGLCLF